MARINQLNDWLKKYCAENHIVYLDYFSAMVDAEGMLQRDLSDDGLHPNAKGYAVMTPLAEQAISAALTAMPAPIAKALAVRDISLLARRSGGDSYNRRVAIVGKR